jgi:hypothetical protein
MPTLPSVQLGVEHEAGEVTVTTCPLHAADVGVKVNTALVPTGIFITELPTTEPAAVVPPAVVVLVTVPLNAVKLTE